MCFAVATKKRGNNELLVLVVYYLLVRFLVGVMYGLFGLPPNIFMFFGKYCYFFAGRVVAAAQREADVGQP